MNDLPLSSEDWTYVYICSYIANLLYRIDFDARAELKIKIKLKTRKRRKETVARRGFRDTVQNVTKRRAGELPMEHAWPNFGQCIYRWRVRTRLWPRRATSLLPGDALSLSFNACRAKSLILLVYIPYSRRGASSERNRESSKSRTRKQEPGEFVGAQLETQSIRPLRFLCFILAFSWSVGASRKAPAQASSRVGNPRCPEDMTSAFADPSVYRPIDDAKTNETHIRTCTVAKTRR